MQSEGGGLDSSFDTNTYSILSDDYSFYSSEDERTPRESFFQLTKTKAEIILIIASLIIIVNEVATFLLERKVYKPKGKQAEDFYEKYKNNSRFLTIAMVLIIFMINMKQLKAYQPAFKTFTRQPNTMATFMMVANVLVILALAVNEIVRHFVSNKFYTEYNRYFVSALALLMILFIIIQYVFMIRLSKIKSSFDFTRQRKG